MENIKKLSKKSIIFLFFNKKFLKIVYKLIPLEHWLTFSFIKNNSHTQTKTKEAHTNTIRLSIEHYWKNIFFLRKRVFYLYDLYSIIDFCQNFKTMGCITTRFVWLMWPLSLSLSLSHACLCRLSTALRSHTRPSYVG